MHEKSSEGTDGRTLAERIAALPPEKRKLFQATLQQKRLTGFDLVARSLKRIGIANVYSVSGRPIDESLPACAKAGVRPLGVYHQSSAVLMAAAQNYVAGRMTGAVIVSAGPAITNTATGVLTAYQNAWPVLVIGGGRTLFQDFEALPVFESITKWAAKVPSTSAIPEYLERAYQAAITGRPGPVFLEIHEDHWNGNGFPGPTTPLAETSNLPRVSEEQLDAIMTALRKAKRPLLIFGKGIRWTTDFDQLRTLVEELGLPFITSPMSRGYLPDDHRLCFNMARKAAQAEADVVIVLAARLNWVFRHGADIHREARIFQIDVVADDSPLILSNVERVVSDAGDFLDRLVQRIHVRESEVATAARNQQIAKWHAALETIRSQTVASIEAAATSDQSPMSPYRLMREIRDALPKDVICVTEGNVSMMVAQQVIPALTPVSRLDAGVNGCMGVGLPFAIGAKVACPDRPVVAICGDYGFSLAAVEIETCVRHNIPIVIIVVNNSGNNGVLKHRLYPMDYGERVTMFQSGLRYDDLAASLGAQGYSISHPNELAPALRAAVASQRPVCINAFVDPTTPLPNAWGPQLGAHLSSPSCRSHE